MNLSLSQLNNPDLLWSFVPLFLVFVLLFFSIRRQRGRKLGSGERLTTALIGGACLVGLADLAPEVIESLEKIRFTIGKQKLDLWFVLHGAFSALIILLLALWVSGLIERRLTRLDTLDGNLRILVGRLSRAVLLLFALLFAFSILGIDVTALSVFTGALGVGLGLGLQKIASNYVSGFIILLDRSIRIGSIIQVGNEQGEVTRITTRYTVLKHPGGSEFIIPNETLTSNTVQNQTYSDSRLRLSTLVVVAYSADLELAVSLLAGCATAHPRVLSEPAPQVLLTRFAENGIDLELGFWIDDPQAGKPNILSEINFAIWHAFRSHGIQMPLPQREVRILEKPAGMP